ncbi:hypothetical protein [Propionibacterium freudenreichii]|uniref:hypothetical protein n=1 Tax=Propionibacterium freudenreichii TaxID=1744 RepID=UPI0021A8A567|nr:hypothetical protein [Propionibacterium freudenreichii]MCT3013847.1 hypothetical protein [Propionibacterium freudenreichii]MDK9340454.1 hypothetical protein [Propionibacterium freudenreichii]MDK9611700.1 hypothetical protein [Propionibacterium freudenreichii]MDK9622033.1 hypothetical protein [Propionibacterium freudenreichii]MDK9623376.1 hypothetical protein [Propionibacterium freudenreichii]
MIENPGQTNNQPQSDDTERPEVRLVPVQLEINGSYALQLEDDKKFHPVAQDIVGLCELLVRRSEDLGAPLLPSIDQSDSANEVALANAAPFPIISDRYGTLEVPVDMAGFLKSMDESTPYTGELLDTDLMHIGQMMKELSIKTGIQWVPMPVGKAENGELGTMTPDQQ